MLIQYCVTLAAWKCSLKGSHASPHPYNSAFQIIGVTGRFFLESTFAFESMI